MLSNVLAFDFSGDKHRGITDTSCEVETVDIRVRRDCIGMCRGWSRERRDFESQLSTGSKTTLLLQAWSDVVMARRREAIENARPHRTWSDKVWVTLRAELMLCGTFQANVLRTAEAMPA